MHYETMTATLEGLTPTILHNGQLANPLNKWAKAIKEISGKKKKTDADYEEMARLEWFGSLYINDGGRVCWPGENIEKLIVSAARKRKEGKEAETGVLCDGMFPINYSGPKDPEKMWDDERFRTTNRVSLRGSSVMRTRPIFNEWTLPLTIMYLPDIVNKKTLQEWIEIGGVMIGLSDWRPKHGRYTPVFNGKK